MYDGSEWFLFSAPLPPDLTPDIHKINDQYLAGGKFGDVYKCRYLCGPAPQEV